MKNGYQELCELLEKDSKYVDENGKLLKNVVQENALKMSNDLLSLLLSNDSMRKYFFTEIGDTLVFDKIHFCKVVESREFLPDSYTQFSQNIVLSDEYGNPIRQSQDVVLQFPNKDCVLEFDSTDENENRDEVFLNETLMKNEIDALLSPKVFHNAIRHEKDKESKALEITEDDNLLIKGNNLIAMHSLLPRYKGRIKLMYWDILYNRKSDKVPYNDSFKHSSWLTMMKNRLEVAKKLLRNNGVICLQCDDNEQAYLKVLCDEIFDRGNFINCISVKMSEASGVKMAHEKKRFPKLKEYLLIYSNQGFNGFEKIDKYRQDTWDGEHNIFVDNLTSDDRDILLEVESKEVNDVNDMKLANELLKNAKLLPLSKKLEEMQFENEEEKTEWLFENSYRIIKTAGSTSLSKLVKSFSNIPKQDVAAAVSKKGVLFYYITSFNREARQPRLQVIFADSNVYKNPCDFWQDIKTTGAISDEGGVKLPNGKKPEKLLYRIIKMLSKENDIVLDAYFGTGTTGAVALKMGRHFIGIEQLDSHFDKATTRLTNVINGDTTGISKEVNWQGGGSFISFELADNAQEYIDKIAKAKKDFELEELYKELKDSDFVLYRVDINEMEKQSDGFKSLSIEDKKKFLISIIDKNTLYINYSDIDNKDFSVSKEDKAFTESFTKGVNANV